MSVGQMQMSHNNIHQNQGENVSVIDSMGSFLFLASQFVSYLLQLFGTLAVLSYYFFLVIVIVIEERRL